MTFGLAPKILNAIDVIMEISDKLGPKMMTVRHIQHIISSPAVRVDDAISDHIALYDRRQRGQSRVWGNLLINLYTPF